MEDLNGDDDIEFSKIGLYATCRHKKLGCQKKKKKKSMQQQTIKAVATNTNSNHTQNYCRSLEVRYSCFRWLLLALWRLVCEKRGTDESVIVRVQHEAKGVSVCRLVQ